jgi:hypothetical protein
VPCQVPRHGRAQKGASLGRGRAEDLLRIQPQLLHRLLVGDAGGGEVLLVLEPAQRAPRRLVQLAGLVLPVQQAGGGQLALDVADAAGLEQRRR